MEPTHDTTFEQSIERLARRFDYPPTPPIAAIGPQTTVRRPQSPDNGARSENRPSSGVHRQPTGRRLAWAALVIALFVATMFAIPQTRAAVLSLFARIGAIDIFIDETAPTPTADEIGLMVPTTATPIVSLLPTSIAPANTIPGAVDHSMTLFALGEPIGLDEARQIADFDLAVPTALGEPDEVYVHLNVDLPAVTLVWRDADDTPLSLTEIGIREFAQKMVGEDGVKYVRVGDRPAVWLEGPHLLQLLGNWRANSLLIQSNVLIWTGDGVTYRLEGDLSEEEMIAIAESLPGG